MTLLASFCVLLYRYSGQQDIVIGTPVGNRPKTELECLIGLFVNTLVLRTQLSDASSFDELLWQVRENCLEAYAHQELPFERLIGKLNLKRDLTRNPIFQIIFTLQTRLNTSWSYQIL